ncbi:MAG: hypothetical protein ACXWNQ_03695 [Anaerolineales bacterium]
MTTPSIALGVMLALLLGALFHVWVDGGVGRLFLFLVLSVAGAATGQWVGVWQKWLVFPIGTLNAGLAIFGSLLFLGIGYWLSLVEIHGTSRKRDGV